MANNESYHKDAAAYLEEVLEACLWERVRKNLWEKGRSRLRIDEVGIFYYRLYAGRWTRLYGLTHNRLRHLADLRILFNDGFSLNLLTGE